MSLENPIIPLADVRAQLRLAANVPDDITLAAVLCQAVNILEKQIDGEMELGDWDVTWEAFPSDPTQEMVFPGLNGVLERIAYTNPATNRVNALTLLANTLPVNYAKGVRRDIYIKAPTTGWPQAVPGTVITTGMRGYAAGTLPQDLQRAVLIMVAKLHEGVVDPTPDREIMRILAPYQYRQFVF